MRDHHDWRMDGIENHWHMPAAPGWARLPIIRHLRAILAAVAIDEHEHFWRGAGLIPTGYDQWVLYGMWHGLTAPEEDPQP